MEKYTTQTLLPVTKEWMITFTIQIADLSQQ